MSKKPKPTKTAGRTRKASKTAAPRGTRDPRLPAPGGVLTRTFKGKEYRVTVLDAVFRFDGSDLMPGAVGAGSEWKELTAWITGQSTKDTLDKIESSWPAS